jgi:hypothetical protein
MSTAANGSCVRGYPITSGFAAVAGTRVTFSGTTLAVAGAGELGIGTLDERTLTTDTLAAVRVWGADESRRVIASEAISAGSRVYCAASGKVSDNGVVACGICRTAASADGDEIVIDDLPPTLPLGVASVAAAGSAQGDAAALVGRLNIVTAADGTKGVILPAAIAGIEVDVYNSVATNGLKIYPASGDDINDGSQDAAITIEGKTHAKFVAVDTTTWAAIFTVNT